MKMFFEKIQNISLVKNFNLEKDDDSKTIYSFQYRDMTILAVQAQSADLTLTRIELTVKATNLLDKVTLFRIYEEINNFNKRVNSLKVTLDKVDDRNVYLDFSVEFSIEDKLFANIKLEDSIKLVMACSKVLLAELLDEEVPEDDIY